MLHILLYILLSIPTVIYCVMVRRWLRAWQRTPEFEASGQGAEPLSVVVCLHDEQSNVLQLIDALERSVASDDIILVCDHCTDGTYDFLASLTRRTPRFRVFESDLLPGKKNAQRFGVMQARYNYVALTDADCTLARGWDTELGECILRSGAQMVIAPVVMRGRKTSSFGRLFELEFLSLQMSTAGAALMEKPIMCNGANLAVNRIAYLEHDGKEDAFVSGDDMFLLSSIKARGGRIAYLKSRHAMVTTHAPASLYLFWRQRTRWLRKATGYNDPDVIQTASFVFVANITWPILLVLSLLGLCHWLVPLLLFVVKTSFETAFLTAGHRFWHVRTTLPYILLLALLYPVMMVFISVLTLFRSKRKW